MSSVLESIDFYDGIPSVHKKGSYHNLPFNLNSHKKIISSYVLHLGLLMSPLYTMWSATAGQYLEFSPPSIAYRIISIAYPIVYLLLAFVVIEQVCRQYIYYRMLQYGFMMKFQESSIWNSLSIPLVVITSTTTFLLVYFYSKIELKYSDIYQISQSVVIQTIQLLGFYLSNIWFQASNTTTLHQYATESDIESAQRLMNQLTIVSESQVQEIVEKLLGVYDKVLYRYPCISFASLDQIGLFSLYILACPSSKERMEIELSEVQIDWNTFFVMPLPLNDRDSWWKAWKSRFWASRLYTTRFMFIDKEIDDSFCSLMRILTLSSWLGWLALYFMIELKTSQSNFQKT